jgi:uncharacterized protein YaeQ
MPDLDPMIREAAYRVVYLNAQHQDVHSWWPVGRPDPDTDTRCIACAERAEAIAAAVVNAAADRMLQHADDANKADATNGSVYTFMVAADRLREWAGGDDRA